MGWTRRLLPSTRTGAAGVRGTAAAVLTAAGMALAAPTAASTVVHGCYKTSGSPHQLFVLTGTATKCPSGYKALSWSQQGPAGKQGAPGKSGPAGASTLDPSSVATLNWWGGNYTAAGDDFSQPDAVAFDGQHIWVTNYTGNSVTEINPASGAPIASFSAAADKF